MIQNYDEQYKDFRYREYFSDQEVATIFDTAVKCGWKPHSWDQRGRLNLGVEVSDFQDDDMAKEFDQEVLNGVRDAIKYLNDYSTVSE